MEQKSFTLAHRILHWLIAFTFIFIILTVWLRMYWLNKDHMADIVIGRLAEMNVIISREKAVQVGRAIRKAMWNWHIYAGYFLIGLYIIRLVIMGIQGPGFTSPFVKKLSPGKRFKSIIYLTFYILLAVTLISGAFTELGRGQWEPVRQVMKAVHVQSLYFSLAFITLHIGGLVLAELTNERGIISKMVHGKEI